MELTRDQLPDDWGLRKAMDAPNTEEPTDAEILAGAVAAANRTDKPPVPEPPTWEVYATPGLPTSKSDSVLRIMHKGVMLTCVTHATVEMGPYGVTLRMSVTLPPDAFVQMKGPKYDWRTAKQAKETAGE